MITIAVQGQQASQMVEIQGAPQPAEGSGDTFRDTFAATVGSVPGAKTPVGATVQPGAAALRSTLPNRLASGSGLAVKSGLAGGTATALAETLAAESASADLGNASAESLAASAADAASADASATSLAGKTSADGLQSAAATLKGNLPVSADLASSATALRDATATLATASMTSNTVTNAVKQVQSAHKAEAASSKTSAASTAAQVGVGAATTQTAVQTADLTPGPFVPLLSQAGPPVPFDSGSDSGSEHQPLNSEVFNVGSIAVGGGSNGSTGAGLTVGALVSQAAAETVTRSEANATPVAEDDAVPLANSAAALRAEANHAGTGSTADLTAGSYGINSVEVAAIKAAASGGPTSAAVLQGEAGAASKDAAAAAGSVQFAASIKQKTSSTPVSGTVFKPVEVQSQGPVLAAPTSPVSRSSVAANSVPSARAGASTTRTSTSGSRDQAASIAAVNQNSPATGAGLAQAVTAPSASPTILSAEAPREGVAASASAARDTKARLTADGSSPVGGSTSVSSQSADAVPQGIVAGDSVAAQKDAPTGSTGSVVTAVALPASHSASAPVAALASGGSGVGVPAISSSGTSPGTRSVGGLNGASPVASSVTGSSSTVSTGGLETGLGTDAAASHRTLLATPTTLEVGVPNGTQGWLRIRAEVGGQGEVNASLAAGSSGAQEALHSQLPALNAFLHSEQMPVTATVADRSFSFAGGHAGTGSQPGGSSDTSGSGSSLFQGGAPQSDAGQPGPRQNAISSESFRGYGAVAGASEIAATATVSQPGLTSGVSAESGQWLNVRV